MSQHEVPSLATPTKRELSRVPTPVLADRLCRIQPLRESTTAAWLLADTDRAYDAALAVETRFCHYRREWLRRGLQDQAWEGERHAA